MYNNIKQLREIIQSKYEANKKRIEFISLFIIALIKAKTVNLADIASVFSTPVKLGSNYRRIQNFFKDFIMDYVLWGKMLLSILPYEKKFIVAIDRTNWKFGKKDINILMLSIVYKKMSFPIVWTLLDKQGSSNFIERIEIMERFLKIVPLERIKSFVADREFDGEEWIKYLVEKEIIFHIRIKHTITYNNCRTEKGRRIKRILDMLKNYRYITIPRKVVIYKQMLYIGGKRLADGDYLILISNSEPEEAQEEYAQRWSIEKLFNKFKSRGFDLEVTHMTDSEKLAKLIGLVSIALIWSFLTGEELKRTYKMKIFEMGKRVKSSFDLGIKYLRNVLTNFTIRTYELENLIKLLSCA
jgi:hypothetical protein